MSEEVTWEERAREALLEAFHYPSTIRNNSSKIVVLALDAIRPIVEEEIAKAAHTHVTSDEGTSYCPVAEEAMHKAREAEAHADALLDDLEDAIGQLDNDYLREMGDDWPRSDNAYRKWKVGDAKGPLTSGREEGKMHTDGSEGTDAAD